MKIRSFSAIVLELKSGEYNASTVKSTKLHIAVRKTTDHSRRRYAKPPENVRIEKNTSQTVQNVNELKRNRRQRVQTVSQKGF